MFEWKFSILRALGPLADGGRPVEEVDCLQRAESLLNLADVFVYPNCLNVVESTRCNTCADNVDALNSMKQSSNSSSYETSPDSYFDLTVISLRK